MSLKVVSWNIAAINNNPFEYWITHDDPDYLRLMNDVQARAMRTPCAALASSNPAHAAHVASHTPRAHNRPILRAQRFIDDPADRDVPVSEVFTQEMWAELRRRMGDAGWAGVDATAERWSNDLSRRKIISGFLKDAGIGDKRLASMPDRVTNTIRTADGGKASRPTVISSYTGDMGTRSAWWAAWLAFHFDQPLTTAGKDGKAGEPKVPAAMLSKIKQSKYPALTAEEEAMSIPLQLLCEAIFDAVLLHIVSACSPDGKWQVGEYRPHTRRESSARCARRRGRSSSKACTARSRRRRTRGRWRYSTRSIKTPT